MDWGGQTGRLTDYALWLQLKELDAHLRLMSEHPKRWAKLFEGLGMSTASHRLQVLRRFSTLWAEDEGLGHFEFKSRTRDSGRTVYGRYVGDGSL